MADFKAALKRSLKEEGVLSNDKVDKGGITKYGISLRFLQSIGLDKRDLDKNGITYEYLGDINHDGVVDSKDILALTVDNAEKLYKLFFWDAVLGDKIYSQVIAEQVFDIAINSGPHKAATLLQQALCSIGFKVTVDGAIGNQTLSTLSNVIPQLVNNKIVEYRLVNYDNIVTNDASQIRFLAGWKTRAKSFLI